MKTIVLLPVKNEAWILESSLKNFSTFADHIIIADQHSTDDSIDIYKRFPKVSVINNDELGHGNRVRWSLLDEARKIDGNNLIICIDADEMISRDAVEYIKSISEKATEPIAFQFSWIQLWKTISKYRVDGVWKDNKKTIAFIDDRKVDYARNFVINDHTSRIPQIDNIVSVERYPLLHFQYVAFEQNQIKQSWYRCSEFMRGLPAKKINLKYSVTNESSLTELKDTPGEWFSGLTTEFISIKQSDTWYFKEILAWFNEKGVEFFEPLDIWHSKDLRDIFIQETGRDPKIQEYSKILILANRIIKKLFVK
jgi:glycosyltransferase involved in cell wall biosynthesis